MVYFGLSSVQGSKILKISLLKYEKSPVKVYNSKSIMEALENRVICAQSLQ